MAEDGGPAFPFIPNQQMMLPNGTWDQNTDFGEPGMTLRQWYAGLAMQSIASAQLTDDNVRAANVKIAREEKCSITELCTSAAYDYADAMIAHEAKDKSENPA